MRIPVNRRPERSKTGHRGPIRLATPALDILRAWNACAVASDPKVFPSQAKGRGVSTAVDNTWKVVRARAGLVVFRLQDLRHNAASVAVNEGVSRYVAGKLLGHRNASTTERYAHVATRAQCCRGQGLIVESWRIGAVARAARRTNHPNVCDNTSRGGRG